jgi:hypothetical protein
MKTWMKLLLAALAVVAVLGVIGWRRIHFQADVGAGFVAKTVCGCMFVAGRSFESCRTDVLPAMHRVAAEVLDEPHGVRAFITLFASRTATWEPRTGCTLE